MTSNQKETNQQNPHPFDQMMFGNKINRPSQATNESPDKEKGDQSFDLIGTAQTMAETYKQLSPYVRGVKGMVKKFKS